MMKQHPTLLLLFVALCTLSNLPAQVSSSQQLSVLETDTTNGAQTPHRMILAADRGFYVAGSFENQGYLSKISACGEKSWTRYYLFGDESSFSSLAQLPSGEVVAVGACRNCAPGDTSSKALVIKTDAQGELLADTTLGNINFDASASAVLVSANGQIAVAGSATWFSFLYPTNAFLAVFNPNLHLTFLQSYNLFYYDVIHDLTQTNEGGYVLCGESSPSLFAPYQASVYRTDALGNLLWQKAMPHLQSRFNSIKSRPDGSLMALGDRLLDTIVKREVYLSVILLNNGDTQSEHLYGSSANDTGRNLELLDNGYLIGASYGLPSQEFWNQRDWVLQLDNNFDVANQYFKDSYLFAHFMVNLIALSPDGADFAYYSQIAFFSSRQFLFVKQTKKGRHTELQEGPDHYQLFPRNLSTNAGVVKYMGTSNASFSYDAIQLKIYREQTLVQTLQDFSPDFFSLSAEIPAELANYTFQLSGLKNGIPYPEAEACDVVAGDAFLIQGQSNAEAEVPYDPENNIPHAYRYHQNKFVRNFGLASSLDSSTYIWHKEKDDFSAYSDNRSGQWGLVLGNRLTQSVGIPIAIINGGISGIPIDSMMPNPANHQDLSNSYGRYLQRLNHSGLQGHFRGLIMFQGESNAAGGFWDSSAEYFEKFNTLDEAWHQDIPDIQHRYLFQIRPGAYWAGATLGTCLQISEAQRQIALDLPDWQIMSSSGMNHDGTHYYYPNGYERAGEDIHRLIAFEIYGIDNGANVRPPSVDTAWFSKCNRQEITLRLKNPSDQYVWTPGWESDFLLEGDPATSVTDGFVSGNLLVLTLSAAPSAGFTGLSYTSHPVGDGAPLKNANGIGLLTFYNWPVSFNNTPISIVDSLLTPDLGSGTGAISFTVQGGTPTYSYSWSTGDSTPSLSNLSAGFYLLTITDAIGCQLVVNWEVPLSVSAQEKKHEPSITVMPNPCQDEITIHINKKENLQSYEVAITDMLGRRVQAVTSWSPSNPRISLAGLPAGSYWIWLLANGSPCWHQLLIKK